MERSPEVQTAVLPLPFPIESGLAASQEGYLRFKRVFDVLLATVAFIIAFPIILIACVAVVLETPGAPIFLQRQIGAGGKVFRILKIRTMHNGMADASFVTKHEDPRVTFIGNILRKTKIDELPQLINIIAGDMSVIGARPLSEDECNYLVREEGIDATMPGFVPQLQPGLIGLEQVNRGPRQMTYADRFALNALYEEKLSFQLDAEIFMQSVFHCRVLIYAVASAFIAELAFLSTLN